MPTLNIRVSNVKQKFNDQWVDYKPGDELFKGKFGASLKVGHKVGDEWTNYFVNDEKLFGYFTKGAHVTVEYETNKGGFNVIRGVAPDRAEQANQKWSGSGAPHGARDKSIELQVVFKGYCEVYSAMNPTALPDPVGLAEWVTTTHALIFAPSLAKDEVFEQKKEQLVEALDATEEPAGDEPAEEFPF